jgi:hypothetical protein
LINNNYNLPAAPAFRGAQAAGDSVESELEPLRLSIIRVRPSAAVARTDQKASSVEGGAQLHPISVRQQR